MSNEIITQNVPKFIQDVAAFLESADNNDRISALQKDARNMQVAVKQAELKLQREYLNKLRQAVRDIPGFWPFTLMRNESVMTACTSKQDLDAFGYLKDVELVQDADDFRAFELKFATSSEDSRGHCSTLDTRSRNARSSLSERRKVRRKYQSVDKVNGTNASVAEDDEALPSPESLPVSGAFDDDVDLRRLQAAARVVGGTRLAVNERRLESPGKARTANASADFTFAENPYFNNTTLVKKYVLSPELAESASPKDAAALVNALAEFDPEEDLVGVPTAIDWKSPEKNLIKLQPRELPTLDEDNMDSLTAADLEGDMGSFFHFFTEEEDPMQLGLEIATDILPQTIDYFLGLAGANGEGSDHDSAFGSDDDEDDEEDGDENAEIDLEEEETKRPTKKAKRS
ncbi:hypothetical protein QFC19_001538 [Naganishia cerealis]|uniref:Uncharacterized protein n=1 Tax=Naganishia cerealis TaxID=610337 RepID=A0ACC2WG22_9TREE|nr:hypothetical protein QFC19_001538 [Naganishia cerealis]